MNAEREAFIQSFIDRGKTREQAEAFLAIMGSAFRRRGWMEGSPLTEDEIGCNLDVFLGEKP